MPEAPGEVAFSEPGGPAEPPPLVADLLRGLLHERELVEYARQRGRHRRTLGKKPIIRARNRTNHPLFRNAKSG